MDNKIIRVDMDAFLASVADGDLSHADALIASIERRPEFQTLAADIISARERAATAAVALDEATRNATVHDPVAISRKIDTIDARARTAADARGKLETEIARLEGTIESEGGKGLADLEAAAREEAEEARADLQRVTQEADMLKLLRDTLEKARNETSAKFVGPVASAPSGISSDFCPAAILPSPRTWRLRT